MQILLLISSKYKEKVFELLSRLDNGKTNLCHGDFHPQNILYNEEKHWVIDWGGASRGDPEADACMTYFYEKRSSSHFADTYLHSYCKNSNVKQDKIFAWLPVIAA